MQKATIAGLATLLGVSSKAETIDPLTTQDAIEIKRNFLVASPALTVGPYFVDENLNRSDLTEGGTRPSIGQALPLVLKVRLWELSGTTGRPLKGAKVDIWHACGKGVYSDEPNGGNGENTSGQKWLRGFQTSDKGGYVEFKTIWPGWYPGRTIHIHFKVRIPVNGQTYDFTSQFFFNDAINDVVMAQPPYNSRGTRTTRNSNDNIYRTRQANGSFAGDQLLMSVSDNPLGGKIGTFDIAFDMDGH